MANVIGRIWACIMNSGTLSSFFLLLWTLMLKTLLISVYFTLLYCGIACLKKHPRIKMSAHAGYYCWYVILLSFAAANLGIGNYIISLSYYPLFTAATYTPYVFIAGCLLSAVWLVVVIIKLARLAYMNQKIRASMKQMERCEDNEHLADRAASALTLRRKPDILMAGTIETPVSYGVFKKTILLPANFKEKYTETELYLLLLHEMTHIKHGDTVKLFMIRLAGCFLWLTPVMGRFVESFKRDSEVLCDNRVMGLRVGERDTYGNLLLKECRCRNARFGFGFSDSYHAMENRLDALYRYKAPKHLKLLTVIPAALLLVCFLSYTFRADWFVVNDKYNTEFDITVMNEDFSDPVSLPSESCAGIYTLADGKIIVDTVALQELTMPYAVQGYSKVQLCSYNYTVQNDKTVLSSSYRTYFDIHEHPDKQELSLVFSQRLNERTFAEYLFLLITSKL